MVRRRLAASTSQFYDSLRRRTKLRPRLKLAARMIAGGIARTQREAAEAVGLSESYLSLAVTRSPVAEELMHSIDRVVEQRIIETSALIRTLSAKAIEKLGDLMTESEREDIQLRAAIDLADRGPETSKIHKHQVESFTLSGRDVKALAEAIALGKASREEYSEVVKDGYDRIQPVEEK